MFIKNILLFVAVTLCIVAPVQAKFNDTITAGCTVIQNTLSEHSYIVGAAVALGVFGVSAFMYRKISSVVEKKVINTQAEQYCDYNSEYCDSNCKDTTNNEEPACEIARPEGVFPAKRTVQVVNNNNQLLLVAVSAPDANQKIEVKSYYQSSINF